MGILCIYSYMSSLMYGTGAETSSGISIFYRLLASHSTGANNATTHGTVAAWLLITERRCGLAGMERIEATQLVGEIQ